MSYFKYKAIHTLRVNIKSLQEESRIIRKEILRCRDPEIKGVLNYHRIYNVRNESRITQLALSFVKGKKFKDIEPNSKSQPDWNRLYNKIKKHYHIKDSDVKQWIEEAKQSFNT